MKVQITQPKNQEAISIRDDQKPLQVASNSYLDNLNKAFEEWQQLQNEERKQEHDQIENDYESKVKVVKS